MEGEGRNRRLPLPYAGYLPRTRLLLRPAFVRHGTQKRVRTLRDEAGVADITDARHSANGLLRSLGMGLRRDRPANHRYPVHHAHHKIDTAEFRDLIQGS